LNAQASSCITSPGATTFLKKGALRVTLTWHNRELKRGTLASIIDQAGLTVPEFVELL